MEVQSRLVVGGESEGEAHQGVDVVASQQGQSCQLVLSDQCQDSYYSQFDSPLQHIIQHCR